MKSKKRYAADGFATMGYRNWFEEAVNTGNIEAMKGERVPNMYDGTNIGSVHAMSVDWCRTGAD